MVGESVDVEGEILGAFPFAEPIGNVAVSERKMKFDNVNTPRN